MLSLVLAHVGRPPALHDLWSSWNFDPLIVAGLVFTAWVYRRGRLALPATRRRRTEVACFAAGLAVVAVALVSPLDTVAGALVSAHMVQHLLLMVVAAPLLVLGNPSRMWSGLTPAQRRTITRWRRRLLPPAGRWRGAAKAIAVVAAVTAVTWFWHARVPYQMAGERDLAHALQHVSFLVAAVWFWAVVIPGRRSLSPGTSVIVIFVVAMQGVFLSALMTFSDQPWYRLYADSAVAVGIEPIADQRLAGLIMWIPAGLIYTATALISLAAWLNPRRPGPLQGGERAREARSHRSIGPRSS